MTEKLHLILNEIESGKRKNIFDVDITIEEYLSKDSNGVSFIEHLLKNDVSIKYQDESKFGKYGEIIYFYWKYDKSLLFFDLEEDVLFSEINGKRLIDYFISNKKLTRNMIKAIKNHTEIVDIILEVNNWQADEINKEILEKFMVKDSNGEYLIEKYFKNGSIKYLIENIDNAEVLIELCQKYNQYDLLQKVNERVLLYKINDNTLLEQLINQNIIPFKLGGLSDSTDINFINYLRKNKSLQKFFKTSEETVLLREFESGKTILEEIIENGFEEKLNKRIHKPKTIAILQSHNKLDLASDVSEKLLLTPIKDLFNDEKTLEKKLLLEYMLEKGYNPLEKLYRISEKRVIKILYDNKYYELLGKKLSEEDLFIELENGVPIIDTLLEKGTNINFSGNYKPDIIAKKLYQKNRLDLLIQSNLKVLLMSTNDSSTYLDHVLEAIKSKKLKCNLNHISFYKCSVNEIAKFYLTLAKHDMIEYSNDLEEKDLLKDYDGKTLLDELLDLDSELTLKEVITDSVKAKMKIAIILKSRGLETKDIDVPLEQSHFTEKYLEGVQNTLGIGPFLSEGEELLKRLEELFSSDGKSDPSLVSALISGYRHGLLVNYNTNIQELRNLVEIKEKNLDKFIYVKEEDSAFFDSSTGEIHADSPVVETILHETGHAMHHYLASNNIPDEYEVIIEKIRANPENLKNVQYYANKYSQLRKKMKSIAEKKYQKFFENYFNADKESDIETFLQGSLQDKKDEFKSLGISEEILDVILDNIFTKEEYINHQKEVFVKEYTDHMLRSKFGAFITIGDILDAIYLGELNSGTLKTESGNKINRTYGHGISYYSYSQHGFDEMVANFASISKSKDSVDMLKLLKLLVGEELYNMLSEFYYNNIVISNAEEKEEAKSI